MSDRRANRRSGEKKGARRRTRIVPALLFGIGAGAAPAIQACDAMTSSNPDGSRAPDDLSFRGFPIDVCGNCWRIDMAQTPPDLDMTDMAMPDLDTPDLPPAPDMPILKDAAPTDAIRPTVKAAPTWVPPDAGAALAPGADTTPAARTATRDRAAERRM